MGFKLAFMMGLLLMGVASGSYMYIKYLNDQIAILRGMDQKKYDPHPEKIWG